MFDDSYIIDADTERAQWLSDLQMGIRSKTEFRMHFYGESETEAKKHVTPTLDELMKGMEAGVVGQEEIRQYLFPFETKEESLQRIAEIKEQNDAMSDEAFEKQMLQNEQIKNAELGFNRDSNQQEDETPDELVPDENSDLDINTVPF